jgi:hypothetical protein
MPSQATLELLVKLRDEASKGLDALGGALGNVGMIAGGVALAGVAALGAAVVAGVGDAREAAKIYAQTENVIRSTGGAAGVTADQVSDLAASLSAASGASLFGDDDIQQSTNLLLTFTNIKESALEAATAISVDMAQALGGAPKDAAIQLGKALNDPIAGISALSRVGVSFTEEQKAQIKTMQEAGDMAGAQAVIRAELNKEFGGSAAAAAAADGGWAQFNDRMGEAAETVGAAILPLLGVLSGFLLGTIVPAIETAANAFAAWLGDPAVQAGIQQIGDAITTGLGVAFDFIANTAIPALLQAWAFIQPAIAVVGGFILDTVIPALGVLAGWFAEQLPGAIEIITTYWNTTLLPIFSALVELWTTSLQPALSELLNWLGTVLPPVISALADFWKTVLQPAIALVAQFIAEQLIPKIGELVNWLRDNLPPVIKALAGFWNDTLLPAIKAVWGFINDTLIPVFTTLVGTSIENLKTAIKTVSDLWTGTLKPALDTVAKFAKDTLTPALDGIKSSLGYISDAAQKVIDFFGDLGEAIDAIEIPSWLKGQSPPPLANWLTYIGDAALGVAKNALPTLGGALSGVGKELPHLVGQLQQVGNDLLRALETSVNAGSKKVQEKIKTLRDVIDDLPGLVTSVGASISKALASGFEAEGSIDRLIAKNLDAVAGLSSGRGGTSAAAQAQLDEALKQAAGFADPQEAAAFFDMRSKQILELAELQDRVNKDLSEGDKRRLIAQQDALEQQLETAEGSQAESLREQIAHIQDALEGDLSASQRSIIDRQLALITAAQEAERKAFQITADASASPQQQIVDQIQAIIMQLSRISLSEAGIALVDQLATLADLISGTRGFNTPTLAPANVPVDSRGQPVTIHNVFNLPQGSTRDTVNAVIAQLNQQVAGRR